MPPRELALLADLNKANKVETPPMEGDEQHVERAASGKAVRNMKDPDLPFAEMINTLPALAWSCRPDGEPLTQEEQ